MRPINLTISAFGPYKDKVVIPMNELGTQGLYVIAGDTGAGKTTIFDAITYALYGEVSSSDKKTGAMLRSKYADKSVKTYVELEFLYRGTHYKIRRSPEYFVEGRKSPYKAEVCLSFPGTDRPDIVKKEEVKQKIIDIMGVDKNQFCQIAMIAQGEFMKLLRTDSEGRKKIYSHIFKTGLYGIIEKRVSDDFSAAKKELENQQLKMTNIISALSAPDSYKHSEQLDNIKTSKISKDNIEERVSVCSELIELDEQKHKELEDERVTIEQKISDQNTVIQKAEKAVETRDKLEKSRTAFTEKEVQLKTKVDELKQVQAQQEYFDELQKETTLLKDSLSDYDKMNDYYSKTQSLANDIQSLDAKLKALEEKQTQDSETLKQKKAELQDSSLCGLDGKLTEHNHTHSSLCDKQAKLLKLKESSRNLTSAQQELEQKKSRFLSEIKTCIAAKAEYAGAFAGFTEYQQKLYEHNIQQTADKKVQLEQKRSQLEQLKDIPGQLIIIQNTKKELAAEKDRIKELKKDRSVLNALKADKDTAAEKLLQAEQTAEQSSDSYNKAYHLFIDNQAGLLAQTLKPGTPCPVCGSLEHPSIALLNDEAFAKDMVDSLKAKAEADEAKCRECEKSKTKCEEKYNEKLSSLNEKARSLLGDDYSFDKFDIIFEQREAALDSDIEQTQAKLNDIEKKSRLMVTLDSEIKRDEQVIQEENESNSKFSQTIAANKEHLNTVLNSYKTFLDETSVDYCKQLDLTFEPEDSYTVTYTETEPSCQKAEKLEKAVKQLFDDTVSARNNTEKLKAAFEKSGTERLGDSFSTENADMLITDKLSEVEQSIENENNAIQSINRAIERKKLIEQKIGELENALENYKTAISETDKKMTKSITDKEHYETQYNSLRAKLKHENKQQAESVIDNNEKQITEHSRKIEELNSSIATLSNEKSTINGTISQLKESFNETDIRDIDQEKLKLSALQSDKDVNKQKSENVHSRLTGNRRIRDSLKKEAVQLEAFEQNRDMLGALNTAISATKSNGSTGKVTLEVYVQSHFFDRIIRHANTRLLTMTNGQYELKRRIEAENNSSKTGLDLNVIDHYNETERSVASLSGGESFKASLALALGLSDEIQSTNGGISLETMFVDEGFGSLDEESLQSALRMLMDLASNGSSGRLIGIISHVGELKKKIDKQIVVTKDRNNGSKVEIKV